MFDLPPFAALLGGKGPESINQSASAHVWTILAGVWWMEQMQIVPDAWKGPQWISFVERSTILLTWARSAVKRFILATDDKLWCDPYPVTGKDLYTAGRSPNNWAPSTFTGLLAIIGAAQAVRHTMRYLLCFACKSGADVTADVIVDDLLRREKGLWFETADQTLLGVKSAVAGHTRLCGG